MLENKSFFSPVSERDLITSLEGKQTLSEEIFQSWKSWWDTFSMFIIQIRKQISSETVVLASREDFHYFSFRTQAM
jgi:hypothetical protein